MFYIRIILLEIILARTSDSMAILHIIVKTLLSLRRISARRQFTSAHVLIQTHQRNSFIKAWMERSNVDNMSHLRK